MHPALSVIFFTTASGTGYGLLFGLIIISLAGLELDFAVQFFGYLLAFAAITFGLISSLFHLGRPERSWRAFTQWRSSWLSREGVVASFTYLPGLLFALGDLGLIPLDKPIMLVIAVVCLFAITLTVCCTAMIYASLKPIPAWYNHLVVPNYCALALHGGSYLLFCLLAYQGELNSPVFMVLLLLLLAAFLLKVLYWRHIDSAVFVSDVKSATGLGRKGDKIELFEAPHSQSNYLMQEMDFRIARKHSKMLRYITIIFVFLLPFLMVSWFAILPSVLHSFSLFIAITGIIFLYLGLICERWLFFAEAKHTVSLYYGRSAV